MNLVTDYINELGGYEVAKERSTPWLANHGENWRNVKEATLLEYRRQHNIFDVGDAMVIPSRGNGVFHFNALFSDGDIAEARHATDAEIKAGKRLEVK